VRISNTELEKIIKEEINEGLRTSMRRARSAQEIADALKQLEKIMIHLLDQKRRSDPGTPEHDGAKEQMARIAELAQEYAYRNEMR